MNARVARLKERLLKAEPAIVAERARIATRVFRETESEPAITRRALLFRSIMREITVVIHDDELIVGSLAPSIGGVQLYPEFSSDWIERELDTFDRRQPGLQFIISEETKAELRQDLPYWRGKTVADRAFALMPDTAKRAMKGGMFASVASLLYGIGHIIADYETVLRKGFRGLRAEAEKRLSELSPAAPDFCARRRFLEAVVVCCDAMVEFAHRYAARAEELARSERSPERRVELETISRICKRVPENPASTFWEALQSFWFVHLAIQLEANGVGISPGRFDQYMWPYLEEDMRAGRVTEDQARELLGCLWIKFNEINQVADAFTSELNGPYPSRQNLVLGGQTPDGRDATNRLSYLCLDVTEQLRLHQPSLSLRFHAFTPTEFLKRAVEVLKTGTGLPAFYNDEVIIPGLLSRGIRREDARNYGIVGCTEPSVPGKSQSVPAASKFNLPKCLELALNSGVSPETGEELGPRTGNPTGFSSFDDVMAAFRSQVAYCIEQLVSCENAIDVAHKEVAPLPFLSSIVENCIERCMSIQEGGAVYNFTGPQGVGLANVADSLAAIEKLVYDEKSVTWAELQDALQANFEGYESLRRRLLEAPKYGNDDDYVDSIAREVVRIYASEVEKHRNPRGGMFHAGMFPATSHIALGRRVLATPDGRRAREPFADGISPGQGRDKHGMTAVLNSVVKLDHMMLSNGIVFNQKIHPALLDSEKSLMSFVALLRTYFLGKGMQIQFNVVDGAMLRDAQAHPEKYRDLVVRVAGWSAFFVLLDRSVQDDIIARTEQCRL